MGIMRTKPFVLVLFIVMILSGMYLAGPNNSLYQNKHVKNNSSMPVGECSITEFIDKGWAFPLSEISKDQILSELGTPNRVLVEYKENPYCDEKDAIYRVSYGGLKLIFTELSTQAGGGVLFSSISINSKRWPLKFVSLGMNSTDVVKHLGTHGEWVNATTLKYTDGINTPNVVFLYFLNDRLIEVVWELYSG